MTSERGKADYVLLLYFIILLIFGLIMLTSASSPVGYAQFGDKYFFIKRQLLYGVIPGLVAFFVFAKLDYKILKKYSLSIFIGLVSLLVLVFIPGIGSDLGTSTNSWIMIAGRSFQPAEFAKLGLVIFLSAYLAKVGKDIVDPKLGFLPSLMFGMIPVVLIVLQPDIGTVSILFAILFGLIFIAGAKLWHMGALAIVGVIGLILMVLVAPYRAARLTTFLHPELDPQGIGYHINQAYLAVGSGGFFGLGLGHSRQKYQYLPEVHADSIYAVIAEEMGFLFSGALIVLLILIASRSLQIAKRAPDKFCQLLVAGIIIWFMSQSFLNIGAMVGLTPLTGVPLPFVSHGGTALMVSMAGVGILINVSKLTKFE
ncbi:putative lipid II flippase FtsW [Patescibacteria group bacterium]|nr:putative lipid II flippase FtsW [Patescibacteria group bacterium]MBU1895927.1 putative lipid II flippase FtsW [Patescibacteria group bacterium]